MVRWYRFWYLVFRRLSYVAYNFSHVAGGLSHACYVRGGKRGRRAKRPLTAVYRWWVANVRKG